MNTSLTRAVLSGTWLMHPMHAHSYLPIVAAILRGESIDEKPAKPRVQLAHLSSEGFVFEDYNDVDGEITENSIAIVTISGPVIKDDGPCGEVGTKTLTSIVKEFKADPNVLALLLDIDTPGGQHDGTQTLADAIHDFGKPTLGFVNDGLACSAGQMLVSSTDETWISHKSCIMGSIGTYSTLADMKKYYKAMGLEIHEIYADQSTEKNKEFHEAMKKNYKPLKETVLNPIVDQFIDTMLEYRKGKLVAEGDHFKGKIYMGDDCIAVGLADKRGTMEEAIQHLISQAKEIESNQFFNQNNTEMKFKSAWAAIMSAIGFGNVASEEEAPLVTEERLEQLNGSLEAANGTIAEREATIAQLQADLQKANDEKGQLTASVTTLTAERDALQVQVEELGAQPGDKPTETKTDKQSEGPKTEGMSEQEQFESYDHNKKALEEIKNIA